MARSGAQKRQAKKKAAAASSSFGTGIHSQTPFAFSSPLTSPSATTPSQQSSSFFSAQPTSSQEQTDSNMPSNQNSNSSTSGGRTGLGASTWTPKPPSNVNGKTPPSRSNSTNNTNGNNSATPPPQYTFHPGLGGGSASGSGSGSGGGVKSAAGWKATPRKNSSTPTPTGGEGKKADTASKAKNASSSKGTAKTFGEALQQSMAADAAATAAAAYANRRAGNVAAGVKGKTTSTSGSGSGKNNREFKVSSPNTYSDSEEEEEDDENHSEDDDDDEDQLDTASEDEHADDDDDEEEAEEDEEANLSKEELGEMKKEEGNELFKKKNYNSAVSLYGEAIELCPTNPSYLSNRAAAYISLKEYSKALSDCESSINLPQFTSLPLATRSKIFSRLARCHLAQGRPVQALDALQNAKVMDPMNTQIKADMSKAERLKAYLDNAKKSMAKDDWGMAMIGLEHAEKAGGVEEVPMEWKMWKLEGLINRSRFEEASFLASDLLRANPNNPEVLYFRALVLYHTGSLAQAIQHCQKSLKSDPEFKKPRVLLRKARTIETKKEEGTECFKKGKLKEAVEKWTEALEADEENKSTGYLLRSNRATAWQRLGESAKALTDCDAALAIQPTHFKALRTRGRANLALENFEEGVRDLKSAFQNAPTGSDDEANLKKEVRDAEEKLKKSKRKNYYKILGNISETATEDEIKKAYRQESLKHHPDKGGDEEKFKEIGEAYAILSDPQRRRRFDAGIDENDPTGGMGGGFGGGSPFAGGGVNLDDFLFGGGFGGSPFGGGGGFGGGGYGGHHHHGSRGGSRYSSQFTF